MIHALLMGLPTVGPRTLNRGLRYGYWHILVFDVNSLDSFQHAHVPNAQHLDPLTFTAEDLPDDKKAFLVFYCANRLCRKGALAARKARRLGYPNVIVMSAGIKGWLAAGLPTESA